MKDNKKRMEESDFRRKMRGAGGMFMAKELAKCVLTGYGNGYPEALCGELFFSWYCENMEGKQQKYALKVRNWKEEIIWDSGWIRSAQSDSVAYEGPALEPDCDYTAQVIVVDDQGNQVISVPEVFSTGIGEGQWHAQWLQAGCASAEKPAPVFRKEFSIGKEVTRAKLYVCGVGYQESYINGQKIGNDVLSPAWTDYRHRVSYNTYDVKDFLRVGKNVFGIQLGNGWYSTTCGMDEKKVLFTMQISVEYADGEKEWICSRKNDGWQVYMDGPMKQNSIYIGEVYDARAECGLWREEAWLGTVLAEPPKGMLVPQDPESIEPVAQLTPEKITEIEKGTYVVDFGQNIAGFVELEVEEERGTEIRIRYSEILDKKGWLNTANLRTAQAKDIFISAGKKVTYRPRFTYHGFRYVEVKGITKPLQAFQIKAIVIRNAVKTAGSFFTDNEMVNKIQKMCCWTENNNLHGVPTDCPQRDERLGWLNDLTVRAEELVYNFNVHRFFRKYLQDIADAQGKETGAITDTAPYVRYGNQPADPVCSSYLILGWLLYMHYGDKEVLSRFYDGFAAWTDYLADTTEDGIVSYSYYGDWAAPIAGSIEGSLGAGAVSAITPGQLMSTGFLYYNAKLMGEMAEVLEKKEDAVKWQALAERTKVALNRKYYHEAEGNYATNSQASNTFMAWLDVSPDKEKTVQAIVEDVKKHENHLTTGNICSRYILEVLTENGYVDLAYEMVTQTTYPSWGYMVANGATTTWERWEYVDSGPLLGMASHDHPMYSTVSAWFYRYLLGIQPTKAGFQEFQVQPYIPEKLNWVKGSLNTIKGEIQVEWKKEEDGKLGISVMVPFNTRCRLVIPQGMKRGFASEDVFGEQKQAISEIWLEAGSYEFSLIRA